MPYPAPDLDEVLDVTAELVIQDSLGAVTIRSVASRLDVTDDELLELFPTLTDLLVSMVNREYAAMFGVVLDNVERDPLGGLLSHIVRYTLAAIYERELARALYLSDPDGLNSVMRASYGLGHTPHLHLRSSFIEQMQLAGMVREDVDPEWITAAISAIAAGMALTSPHDDLDDIVDGISLMLVRSVDVPTEDTTPGKIVFCEYATSLASRTGHR
jgi:AcrR family transcriptional regulator